MSVSSFMAGLVLVAGPAWAADAPALRARGQTLLATHCSGCHAIDLTAESQHPDAPPLRVVVTRYEPSSLAEALAEGIVSGHPDMPELTFEPSEIDAIIAYLDDLLARQLPAAGGSQQTP